VITLLTWRYVFIAPLVFSSFVAPACYWRRGALRGPERSEATFEAQPNKRLQLPGAGCAGSAERRPPMADSDIAFGTHRHFDCS